MAKTPRPKIVSKKHLARLEREQIQRRYLITAAVVVVVAVVGLILYGILDQQVLQYNKAVATVNSEKIPLRDFQARVRFYRLQLINQYQQTYQLAQMFGQDPNTSQYFASQLQQIQSQLATSETVGQMALDQLVDEAIIRQEAERQGITVTDAEVEARMQEFFGYFPNGTPTPAPAATEWATPTLNPTQLAIVTITPTPTEAPTETPAPTEAAAATEAATLEPTPAGTETPEPTATPYTEEGYQGQIKDYNDNLAQYNISVEDLKDIFRNEILRNKVLDKIAVDVQPEQEMVWARHILVPDEGAAQAALEKIRNGEDFAAVAAQVSTDDSNKNNGGDLGWFAKGDMVAEFETAAFSLEVGQLSDPVKTQFGYHIIQVLGHEVRPLTAEQLDTARQSVFGSWLDEQRGVEGAVVTNDDFWKARVPSEPTLEAQG